MRLWRITRADHVALDGAGAKRNGARYSSPGLPVVHFASEAGLAVLVALRYLPEDRAQWPNDMVLGWTEIDATPERIPIIGGEVEVREWVDHWLKSTRSLLAEIPSRVLPEGNVVMMNPVHSASSTIPPLTVRRFDFAECLHRPPMFDQYAKRGEFGED